MGHHGDEKGGKFEKKKSHATFTGKANKVILVLLRIIQCRNITSIAFLLTVDANNES